MVLPLIICSISMTVFFDFYANPETNIDDPTTARVEMDA